MEENNKTKKIAEKTADRTAEKAAEKTAEKAVEKTVERRGHEGEIKIEKLKEMKISELSKIAKQFSVDGVSALKKQDLIFKILQAQAEKNGLLFGEGVL